MVGFGVKIGKSAGDTYGVEALDGDREALKEKGRLARVSCDGSNALSNVPNESLTLLPKWAKGFNGDRKKEVMALQL